MLGNHYYAVQGELDMWHVANPCKEAEEELSKLILFTNR